MLGERRSLCAIKRAQIDSPSLKIGAHIAEVSELWLARLEKTSPSLKVWPTLTMKEIETVFRDQKHRWLATCKMRSAETLVRYNSSSGSDCVNSFDEIIQEVALHGAHHRGQIALLLRSEGVNPPESTDFIPALRGARL